MQKLDIAIVKSTNHVERLAKEKHIRAIFAAISATRPLADVAYCIHALAGRLSKTHNWVPGICIWYEKFPDLKFRDLFLT
ncbi:hypothetical protein ACSBR1_022145 [Camellia fascicularis]